MTQNKYQRTQQKSFLFSQKGFKKPKKTRFRRSELITKNFLHQITQAKQSLYDDAFDQGRDSIPRISL
jgi:hypothetical protein